MTAADVTEQDVRMELGGVSELEIGTDLIEYHLGKATKDIRDIACRRTPAHKLEEAIAIEAAYRVLTSLDDTYHSRSQDVDLSDSYDVATRVDTLTRNRNKARRAVRGLQFEAL